MIRCVSVAAACLALSCWAHEEACDAHGADACSVHGGSSLIQTGPRVRESAGKQHTRSTLSEKFQADLVDLTVARQKHLAELSRLRVGARSDYETVSDIDYYEGEAPSNCVDAAFMDESGFLSMGLRGPADGDRCKLDIYRPVAASAAPVVFFIHPGGLYLFEKYTPESFQERGLIVVSINYRYSGMGEPAAEAPDYVEDAARAFKWTYDHIADYGGDASNIYVVGESAGGWLSSMITLDSTYLAAHGLNSSEVVKGLGIMSGQMIDHFRVRDERGNSDRLKPEIGEMAPMYHQNAGQPKTFMGTAHRDGELYGRYEEMAYAHKLLTEMGHTDNTLVEGPEDTTHYTFSSSVFPDLLDFFGL